jgi:hypothetical protein
MLRMSNSATDTRTNMLKRFKHDQAALNLLEDVYECNTKREALRQKPIPSDFTRISLKATKKRKRKTKPVTVTRSALFAQTLMNLPSAMSESWQAVAVLLWVVAGLGFYTQQEDWTVVQTLYWQVATVTTARLRKPRAWLPCRPSCRPSSARTAAC